MATIKVTEHDVTVALSPWEKVLARRGDLRVPRACVRGVEVVDDALAAVRGVPARRGSRSGSSAVGTWRHAGGKDFVVVRSPRAVCLVLSGSPWSALLVSLPDPEAVAARLR